MNWCVRGARLPRCTILLFDLSSRCSMHPAPPFLTKILIAARTSLRHRSRLTRVKKAVASTLMHCSRLNRQPQAQTPGCRKCGCKCLTLASKIAGTRDWFQSVVCDQGPVYCADASSNLCQVCFARVRSIADNLSHVVVV